MTNLFLHVVSTWSMTSNDNPFEDDNGDEANDTTKHVLKVCLDIVMGCGFWNGMSQTSLFLRLHLVLGHEEGRGYW
jgi:hypothetical protein